MKAITNREQVVRGLRLGPMIALAAGRVVGHVWADSVLVACAVPCRRRLVYGGCRPPFGRANGGGKFAKGIWGWSTSPDASTVACS